MLPRSEGADSSLLNGTELPTYSGSNVPYSSSKHSRSHSTSDFYVTPVSSPPPSPDGPHLSKERRVKHRIKAPDAEDGRRHQTFFSSLTVKFEDMELEEEDGIPTQPFLHRCQILLPFFGEGGFALYENEASGVTCDLKY